VNNECRLAAGTAACFPIDVITVADAEESGGIRLDRRVRLHAVERICAQVTRALRIGQSSGMSPDGKLPFPIAGGSGRCGRVAHDEAGLKLDGHSFAAPVLKQA
jgi:hypothetical protein